MASLHSEVGISDLAEDRQQLPELGAIIGIVVFDSYIRSPKDQDHIRRTKKYFCDLQIQPDMVR